MVNWAHFTWAHAVQLSPFHMLARWCSTSFKTRLQQYMNQELPDVQAGFRKGRDTRDQIANIRWIIEKAREFQKNIYVCFIDYAKAFDCVDRNKLWKILKELGILGHLTCLLRNLNAGQEATVRTGHGTTDCHKLIDHKFGCLFLSSLFCSIDLCLFLCQYHLALITVAV